MIRFTSDYVACAHPKLMAALAADNLNEYAGYGEDERCEAAVELLRGVCKAPKTEIHFVVGGTQANLLATVAALRPHQGVLAADSGHISRHEVGAVEAAGHEILELPSSHGKLAAGQIRTAVKEHFESPDQHHMVQPKLVYISHPTEYGTLYTAKELKEISAACRENDLLLYVDGARMGYGLVAEGAEITLPMLAEYSDCFTIGGTKVGAMFGEAMVFTSAEYARDFRYLMKQRGGMLAKGWLLGFQYQVLFEGGEDCPYLEGSRNAIRLGGMLAKALEGYGIPMLMPPATNQIFPILSDAQVAAMREKYIFEDWERVDESHMGVRFCMAWNTRQADVEQLIEDLGKL